ncbi:MAG TPA: M48 family metalloprotease [Armatimonadota bacterium]|nr:M48 family metalloprotease [Armatimonadota bacterium]
MSTNCNLRTLPGRAVGSLAALIVTSAALLALAAPPARADLFTPSVSEQIKLGDQAAAQVEHQYKVIHDARAAHLQAIGDRLVNALGKDRGPWHWSFHLIQSKEVNAFALPGGNTFFFTGLYDKLTNDNERAAVMGHEMTHVRLQHWAHQYASQQKRQLGLLVLLGLAHANNTEATIADLGNQLFTLKYSRGEEEQADQGGLKNMVAAGYNPCGMIQLFHVLQASGGGGGPSFLSDHPLTSTRIKAAEKEIRNLGYGPC